MKDALHGRVPSPSVNGCWRSTHSYFGPCAADVLDKDTECGRPAVLCKAGCNRVISKKVVYGVRDGLSRPSREDIVILCLLREIKLRSIDLVGNCLAALANCTLSMKLNCRPRLNASRWWTDNIGDHSRCSWSPYLRTQWYRWFLESRAIAEALSTKPQ